MPRAELSSLIRARSEIKKLSTRIFARELGANFLAFFNGALIQIMKPERTGTSVA